MLCWLGSERVGTEMRELVSKAEAGRMPTRLHMASRARTRAAESYRMAVGLGQAKVHISRDFDLVSGWVHQSWTGFRGRLTGV